RSLTISKFRIILNCMKPKSCLTPIEIENRLNEHGVQPTAQRIAICRYVLCEADHPTAEDVKKWADANFPKMSLATVYNTLGILVAAGLCVSFISRIRTKWSTTLM